MSQQGSLPLRVLAAEATRLKRPYNNYVADREFLAAKRCPNSLLLRCA